MNPGQMSQMAGPQQSQQPQPFPGGMQPGVVVSPQGSFTGDPQAIMKVLHDSISQCVDPNGFVDMQKLITIWPQIAQANGVNIPFQTVIQMIQQNPAMIEQLIVQMGLNGIIVNGRTISAEELAGIGQQTMGA